MGAFKPVFNCKNSDFLWTGPYEVGKQGFGYQHFLKIKLEKRGTPFMKKRRESANGSPICLCGKMSETSSPIFPQKTQGCVDSERVSCFVLNIFRKRQDFIKK